MNKKTDDKIVYSNQELKEEISRAIEEKGVHADLNYIDVSNVTNMVKLFSYSKFNGDISNWDVSNLTDMSEMFYYTSFNGDISKWNVSNVIYIFGIFEGSDFNGYLPKWDYSTIAEMQELLNRV